MTMQKSMTGKPMACPITSGFRFNKVMVAFGLGTAAEAEEVPQDTRCLCKKGCGQVLLAGYLTAASHQMLHPFLAMTRPASGLGGAE